MPYFDQTKSLRPIKFIASRKLINMIKKILIPIILLSLLFAFASCSKNCDDKVATCSESPPTDELCQAYFNNWFYDSEKNKCEQIGYSGCESYGFTSEEDCEVCECN